MVEVPVAVPRDAVLTHEGQAVVFVQTAEGFKLRPVLPGRADAHWVEIVRGLEANETVAVKNAFTLKAELGKEAMQGGHSH